MGRFHIPRRRRPRALAVCLALLLLGAGAGPLAAEPAASAPREPGAQTAAPSPPAASALERAAEALAAAEARRAAADAAYSRMRRSNRPRGAARDAIVRERIEARQALLEARQRYEVLARRTGTSH